MIMWTREVIIERIQAWVEEHGEPPTATDWNPGHARATGRHDIANRFASHPRTSTDVCWPYVTTVVNRFGSWNAAITAAGYTPRNSSHTKVLLAEIDYHRAKDAELYRIASSADGEGLPDPFGLVDAILDKCRPS